MDEYISIGELSKITGIPISKIRYYGNIGLLVPALKNEETNYRYYTHNQVIVLKIINHMRNIGFSIDEIKEHFEKMSYEHTMKLYENIIKKTQSELEKLKKIEEELLESYEKFKKIKELDKKIGIPFIEYREDTMGIRFLGEVSSTKELRKKVKSINLFKKEHGLKHKFRGFRAKIESFKDDIFVREELIGIMDKEEFNRDIVIPKGKYVALYDKGIIEERGSLKIVLEYCKANGLKNKEDVYIIFSNSILFKDRNDFIYLLLVEVE